MSAQREKIVIRLIRTPPLNQQIVRTIPSSPPQPVHNAVHFAALLPWRNGFPSAHIRAEEEADEGHANTSPVELLLYKRDAIKRRFNGPYQRRFDNLEAGIFNYRLEWKRHRKTSEREMGKLNALGRQLRGYFVVMPHHYNLMLHNGVRDLYNEYRALLERLISNTKKNRQY